MFPQIAVTSHKSCHCPNLIHAEMDLQSVVLVIPNTGSGPVNVFADPSLAKASTSVCTFILTVLLG
jgi:hypothetical protein